MGALTGAAISRDSVGLGGHDPCPWVSCPGPPLCLWLGSSDGAVTQGTATKGPGIDGRWRDLLAAVGGLSL